MFDVGFTELMLIGLIALLVLGPERLPPLVRSAGRWLGRAQRMARELKTQLENDQSVRELNQFQRTLQTEEARLAQEKKLSGSFMEQRLNAPRAEEPTKPPSDPA
ncbi:MAG: Sec-independent protein translocase protein TatB [Gammaproteobacteria bacterium]